MTKKLSPTIAAKKRRSKKINVQKVKKSARESTFESFSSKKPVKFQSHRPTPNVEASIVNENKIRKNFESDDMSRKEYRAKMLIDCFYLKNQFKLE